jgi:hypothetical protein
VARAVNYNVLVSPQGHIDFSAVMIVAQSVVPRLTQGQFAELVPHFPRKRSASWEHTGIVSDDVPCRGRRNARPALSYLDGAFERSGPLREHPRQGIDKQSHKPDRAKSVDHREVFEPTPRHCANKVQSQGVTNLFFALK